MEGIKTIRSDPADLKQSESATIFCLPNFIFSYCLLTPLFLEKALEKEKKRIVEGKGMTEIKQQLAEQVITMIRIRISYIPVRILPKILVSPRSRLQFFNTIVELLNSFGLERTLRYR